MNRRELVKVGAGVLAGGFAPVARGFGKGLEEIEQ